MQMLRNAGSWRWVVERSRRPGRRGCLFCRRLARADFRDAHPVAGAVAVISRQVSPSMLAIQGLAGSADDCLQREL